MAKRMFDVAFAAFGLLVMALPMVLIAFAILADSGRPVFFRQERVGRRGRLFRIHKFRTMIPDGGRGSPLTVGNDPRITRVGGFLRRSKLDEVPQLFDVLFGRMSIVGPRPELPRYVALYPAEVRALVLELRPGITDPASLAFADESAILGRSTDPEREYVEVILPRKLRAALDYAQKATFTSDIHVIGRSLMLLVRRSVRGPGAS